MATRYDLICLDSCVIFDCLHRQSKFFAHVEPLLRDAAKGNLDFVISILCRCEVLLLGDDFKDDAATVINQFFDQECVHIYNVDDRIALKAAEIRRVLNLETADAVHVATGIVSGAQAFITRDGDGKKKKGTKKTILQLRDKFREIEILTPAELFASLSADARQGNLELPEEG